jgi:hypothetical protein
MQMDINLGTRGATRESWERDAYRIAFREVQEAHPRAGEAKLVQLMVERCEDDRDLLIAANRYGVRNCLNAQGEYMRRAASPREQPTQEELQQEQEEIKQQAKKDAATVLYLNWLMPNNKRLRFCEGNYVAKVCAPMAKAGKKAGNKLMGQVYSEEELRRGIAS